MAVDQCGVLFISIFVLLCKIVIVLFLVLCQEERGVTPMII